MSFKVHPDVKELFHNWIIHLLKTKGCAKNTVNAYLTDFYYFIAYMSVHLGHTLTVETFSQLSLQDFRSWLAAKFVADRKAASNARALSVIRSFYKYLHVFHNIENEAPFLVKFKAKPKKVSKLVTDITNYNEEQILSAYKLSHPKMQDNH